MLLHQGGECFCHSSIHRRQVTLTANVSLRVFLTECNIVFGSDEYFESLLLKLCGELYGSCIDFSLESSDLCTYVSCPLQFNKQYKMKLNIFIKTYWQDVSVTAKWMLEDASGDQKACFYLPVVIKSPTKKPEYTPETGPPKKPPQPLAKALL
ncbi:hypothetical protein GBAR_LOCUS4559 [Geodia barretti]|uniref:MD-2-related lipid-recognition domain-containing protein n=1 Tax=Geodia barretti TaxID=519541 RepID=A0AA35W3F0_GEOBA|nr:hypothetical protein GBAR_LOCUS4559 [Geodia barretti]